MLLMATRPCITSGTGNLYGQCIIYNWFSFYENVQLFLNRDQQCDWRERKSTDHNNTHVSAAAVNSYYRYVQMTHNRTTQQDPTDRTTPND